MSCVIPCWDEAENLKVLLPKVEQTLRRCAPAWEVIVVDDGSRDGSAALLGAWAREPGRLVLQLSRHFGKEAALAAGLEAARGQVVVTMDGDLQHPPELIPSFVERWRAGADVVVASHADRHDESWLKRLGVRGLQALMKTPDHLEIPPGAGDFRLMDHRVVRALRSLPTTASSASMQPCQWSVSTLAGAWAGTVQLLSSWATVPLASRSMARHAWGAR